MISKCLWPAATVAALTSSCGGETTGFIRTEIESVLRQRTVDPSKTRRGKVDLRRRL